MRTRTRSVLVAAVLCCLASPAAVQAAGAPADVSVRVEGDSTTLLPRTTVHTTTTPVPVNNCSGTSAAGALELATSGNWDRGSNFTNTILGETHSYPDSRYWGFYVNNQYSNTGICDHELAPGDQVLFFVDDFPNARYPLVITAPSTADLSGPTTVTVEEAHTTFDANFVGTTTLEPVSGATVTGGHAPVLTGPDGTAQVGFAAAGGATLFATRSGNARSDVSSVCVHNGNDGTCGTTKPGDPPPPVGGGPPAYRAVTASLARPADGARFALAKAPRELAGSLQPGTNPLSRVRVRLRRALGRTCSFYSVKHERFYRRSCREAGFFYTLPVNGTGWSYLLPLRLGAGTYRLESFGVDTGDNPGPTVSRTFKVLPLPVRAR